MEREIKFKVWDKRKKEMVICDRNWVMGNLGNVVLLALNMKNRDLVFMQFTGLLDKNGKEVWEGDIVDIDGLGITEVIWEYDLLNAIRYKHCEIIGNIYENKNLL